MPAVQKQTNPELDLAAGCIFCSEAISVGNISIGAGTIVHPKAQILAENGPIIIGENNLIEENVCIVNKHDGNKTVRIGNNNVFEIGCRCEALNIGDNNIIEINGSVGPDVELTNGCVVGSMCSLKTKEILAPNSVIYGPDCRRRVNVENPALQTSQLEYLRKALPNYHYLVPAKK